MPIQQFADHLTMPWPNGKGTSYEIACQATDDASKWVWRVAIAPVVEDCEFSHFADIDRQLLIIQGGEMVLDVAGKTVICKPGEIAFFPGDQPTTAELPEGPIVDLNLLTQRSKSNAIMTFCSSAGKLASADMIVAVSEVATILVDGQQVTLAHQDAFLDAINNQLELLSGSVAHIKL